MGDFNPSNGAMWMFTDRSGILLIGIVVLGVVMEARRKYS